MAHIVGFSIDGLCGRKDPFAIKLNRDLNVFHGVNGSGKTSLLKILNSAMDNDASTLQNVPFSSAEVTIYSISEKKEFVYSFDKPRQSIHSSYYVPTLVGEEKATLAASEAAWLGQSALFTLAGSQWKIKPKPQNRLAWSHVYLPTSRIFQDEAIMTSSRGSEQSKVARDEVEWDRIFTRKIELLWTRCYNNVLTRVQEIQAKGIAAIMENILVRAEKVEEPPSVDRDAALKRVAAFLGRQGVGKQLSSPDLLLRRYESDAQARNVVYSIDRVERDIENAQSSIRRLEELVKSMFHGNKQVNFTPGKIGVTTSSGEEISLASLSSGEKQALLMFIEAVYAEENTILIDEPEISLHIDWQKNLIPALAQLNSATQLILATHSPEIISGIDDSKIFGIG